MKSMNNFLKVITLIIVFSMPALVYAQAGFGDDVNDTPIDGGLSLLVAAGVGYGAKKIKEKRKKHN